MNNGVAEVGNVTFNEFDALLNMEEDNAKIKALYTLQDPNKKISVVFIKGFSVGINWVGTVEKSDIKAEERDDLEPNTLINEKCKSDFIDIICKQNNCEFLIIWDGDDYEKTCYTDVIPKLLDKLSEKNFTYKLIAYRSSKFEQFKNSWSSCTDIRRTEINIVRGPLITGNHYEDLAVFGREKTATFLNPQHLGSISIFCFGGGPTLEAELTPRLPFESTEIIMYNVTRPRGSKPDMYFQRNYIFKDTKYVDGESTVLAKYFRIKKDERAICQIENDNAVGETLVTYSKNSEGKGSISTFERYGNRKIKTSDMMYYKNKESMEKPPKMEKPVQSRKQSPKQSPKKQRNRSQKRNVKKRSAKRSSKKSPKRSSKKSPKRSPKKSQKKSQKRSR